VTHLTRLELGFADVLDVLVTATLVAYFLAFGVCRIAAGVVWRSASGYGSSLALASVLMSRRGGNSKATVCFETARIGHGYATAEGKTTRHTSIFLS